MSDDMSEAEIMDKIKEKKERLNTMATELADMNIKYHQLFNKNVKLKEEAEKLDKQVEKKERYIVQEKNDMKAIENQLKGLVEENEQLKMERLNNMGGMKTNSK